MDSGPRGRCGRARSPGSIRLRYSKDPAWLSGSPIAARVVQPEPRKNRTRKGHGHQGSRKTRASEDRKTALVEVDGKRASKKILIAKPRQKSPPEFLAHGTRALNSRR